MMNRALDTTMNRTPGTTTATAGSAPWLVPEAVTDAAGDRVDVGRAWPDKAVDGVARVAVEGRDRQGRLRAGTIDRSGTVRLHPPGADRKLPGLSRWAPHGELVVHRSGRRAVVRLPGAYVKVVRPGRAAAVAQAAGTGRELATAAGLAAPRVTASDDDSVSFEVLRGTPVHDLSSDPDWPQIWTTFARRWGGVQALAPGTWTGPGTGTGDHPGTGTEDPPGTGPGGHPSLARHTSLEEAGVLRVWAARAAAAGVLTGGPWPARLAAVAQELEALPPTTLVPSHRDLHDKQLLWHDGTLGVLDLDTACLAEPALDVANLAVHARLRVAQGIWPDSAADHVGHAADELARVAQVPGRRWRVACRATVSRLVAVYAFRPRWRTTVLDWAARTWTDLA